MVEHVREVLKGLLALVELGQSLSGFSYLRVVWVEAQVPVGFGRQGRIFRLGIPQPPQQALTGVLGLGVDRIVGRCHDSILPEALPKRGQGSSSSFHGP